MVHDDPQKVKESDKCPFCDVFCGNSWCAYAPKEVKDEKKRNDSEDCRST